MNVPQLAGNVDGLVSGKFGQASQYADQAVGLAMQLIADLSAEEIEGELINPSINSVPRPEINFNVPGVTPPSINYTLPDLDIPNLNLIDVLQDIPEGGFDVPAFSFTPPNIAIPELPDVQWPTPPPEAPAVNYDVELPAQPNYSLPDPPEFQPIQLPAPPTINTPQFKGERPSAEYLDDPGDLFVYSEEEYTSEVREQLESKLRGDLNKDLVSILPRDFHDDWWAFAEQRLEDERAQRILEAQDGEASRGHTMPTGALTSVLRSIDMEFGRRKDQLNKEIITTARDRALQHLQFIVQQCLVYEQQGLDHFNRLKDRSFQVASTAADVALRLFAARVEKYRAMVAAYQADAAVFESMIRAALTEVEIYKAQIEGARVSAETQRLLTDIYTAQINAVGTIIQVYKTQMEGAKLRVEMEDSKITAWARRIDAYNAQMNGVTAQYNAYGAQVAGEKAKADIFDSMVRAYTAQVTAASTADEAKWRPITAKLQANAALVEEFKAKLSGEMAELDATVKAITTDMDAYRAYVAGVEAATKAEGTRVTAQADMYRAEAEAAAKEAEVYIRAAEISKSILITSAQVQVAAKDGAARAAAALAQGAMSAVNASASMSFAGHQSLSSSYSESVSVSTNINRSE